MKQGLFEDWNTMSNAGIEIALLLLQDNLLLWVFSSFRSGFAGEGGGGGREEGSSGFNKDGWVKGDGLFLRARNMREKGWATNNGRQERIRADESIGSKIPASPSTVDFLIFLVAKTVDQLPLLDHLITEMWFSLDRWYIEETGFCNFHQDEGGSSMGA